MCRDLVLIHESTGRYDPAWEEYKRRFEVKHRAHLPATWSAREGARASFSAASREEVATRCTPAQLARIAAEIGLANAALAR